MECLICHRSNWMQEKCLGFLKNLLENYKDKINDDDVFLPLECNGAEKLLARLVHETFPKDIIEDMSENRRNGFRLELDDDPAHVTLCGLWNVDETRPNVKAIFPALFENALVKPWGEDDTDVFHARMQELQRTLKLSDQEIDILLVSLAIQESILWDPRNDRRRGSSSRNLFMMAKCLNIGEASVLDAVSPQKPLRRFECLDEDLDVSRRMMPFLCGLSDEPLANSYFTKDKEETLPWSDFADLTITHGAILKRMLTSSDKPVNILLYGAPGTGKTSFARALVKEIGRVSYSIAQNTNDRGSRVCSSPDFRFGALQVCDGQVEPKESVIIVDEADEMLRGIGGFGGLFMLFGGGASRTGDKGLLNSVLDTMTTSRTVRHEELLVEGGSAFQDEAVCGASERQRRAFALGDFAIGLAAIEFGGFAEVGQKVARHVLAASAGGVVLVRRDGEESVCVHRCSLVGVFSSGLIARHRCIKEKQGRRKKESRIFPKKVRIEHINAFREATSCG